MRIIAGSKKGSTIAAPRGRQTRPTADKVRGAVFSMLGDVSGARVLDMFAGSGALALEAMSRGASEATMIDNRREALAVINRNITKLKLEQVSARRRDYLTYLKDAAKKHLQFDLIFVDPPYRMHGVIEPILVRWLPRLAAPGARIVVESGSAQDISLPLELVTEKVYGDTMIRIYRAGDSSDDSPKPE